MQMPLRSLLVLAAVIVAAHAGSVAAHESIKFKTRLTPAQEVATPPVDSRAKGQGTIEFHDDQRATVSIKVEKIDNVVAAHIHHGAAGVNGPIVATIYNGAGFPTGRVDGFLCSRTITNNDLNNLPGGMNTLHQLMDEIRAGNIYLHVHTTDFPAGEIRGQMKTQPSRS